MIQLILYFIMKHIKTIFSILIFCIIFFNTSLYANPIEYWKGKVAIDKGNKLLSKGDYDNALKEYEKAKNYIENSDVLYYNIANTFFKKGDYLGSTMAYDYAKKYIVKEKIDVDLNASIYHNSGINNINKRDYQAAIDDFIEALAMKPKDSDTISALEYARKKLKESQSSGGQGGGGGDNNKNNNGLEPDKPEDNKGNNQNKRNNKEQQNKPNSSESSKDKISREEAERILDALRNDRDDTDNTKQNYGGGSKIDKDW